MNYNIAPSQYQAYNNVSKQNTITPISHQYNISPIKYAQANIVSPQQPPKINSY